MPIITENTQLDDFSQSTMFQPDYIRPGVSETVQAAFRLNNTLGSTVSKKDQVGFVNPDFNPIDQIKGTDFEAYADKFIDVGDEVQLETRKAQVKQELQDRDILQKAGWTGVVSGLAAGIMDPVNLIPIFGLGSKIATAAKAGKVFQTAAIGAATGAIGGGIAEIGIQNSQQLATAEESMYTVAASAALGGILGGAIGAIAPKQLGEFKSFLGTAANTVDVEFKVNLSDSAGAMKTEFKGTYAAKDIPTWALKVPTANIDAIMAPAIRGVVSSSQTLRRLTTEMLETHVRVDGVKVPAMETLLKNDAAQNIELVKTADKGYLDYLRVEPGKFADIRAAQAAKSQGKLRYDEYMTEVGKSMRRGDTSDIPQVEALAKTYRTIIETKNKEMGDAGIAPFNEPLMLNKGDKSYLTRIYDTDMIIADRVSFEKSVSDYMIGTRSQRLADRVLDLETNGKQKINQRLAAAEAKGIKGEEMLKRRAEQEATLQRQIDELKERQAYFNKAGEKKVVSKDVSDEYEFLIMEDAELKSRVSEITDKIIGLGHGSVMDDVSKIALDSGVRFTKDKTLQVPDEVVEKFLISDAGRIVDSYVSQANRMLRAKQLLKRNGVDSFTELQGKLKTELDEATIKDPENFPKLHADYQKNNQLLQDIIDMSMERIAVRTKADKYFQYARHYNYLTMLGGMTISAIPDLAMPVLKHGFRETLGAWSTFAKAGVDMRKMVVTDLNDMGVAVETVTNDVLRSFSMSMKSGRFDEASDAVGRYFGKATLMTQWNTMHKEIAAVAAESRIFRNINYLQDIERFDPDYLKGLNVDAKTQKVMARDTAYLQELGIDANMSRRIGEQFKRFGFEQKGAYVLNAKHWTDREAADIIKAAVIKEVDSTIITPDKGSIPIGVQKYEAVKTIFQFKSFVSSMMSKALIPAMQRRDAFALQGVISLLALGTLSYHVVSAIGGREGSKEVGANMKEALSRSGMLGLVMDPMFGIVFGTSRYMNSQVLGLVAGPSGSALSNAVKAVSNISDGNFEQAGNSIMRLIPFMSLFYIKGLLNQMNNEDQRGKI